MHKYWAIYGLFFLPFSAVSSGNKQQPGSRLLPLPQVIVEHTKQLLLNFRWKSYHIA